MLQGSSCRASPRRRTTNEVAAALRRFARFVDQLRRGTGLGAFRSAVDTLHHVRRWHGRKREHLINKRGSLREAHTRRHAQLWSHGLCLMRQAYCSFSLASVYSPHGVVQPGALHDERPRERASSRRRTTTRTPRPDAHRDGWDHTQVGGSCPCARHGKDADPWARR